MPTTAEHAVAAVGASTGSAPTSSAATCFSRVIAGARDILTVAPLATFLGTFLGTALGLAMGYFARARRRGAEPHRRCRAGAADGDRGAAGAGRARHLQRSRCCFVIGFSFAPIIARTVRAGGAGRARARLCGGRRSSAARDRLYIMFVEILPNVIPPILVETTVRLGYAIFTVATLSFIGFGIQPPSPDWGAVDLGQLRPDRRRLLVDGAVRRRWPSPRW